MSSEEENVPLFSRSNRGVSHWNRLKKSTMIIRAVVVFSILSALATGTWLLQRYLIKGDKLDLTPLDGFCAHVNSIQPNEYTWRHKKLAQVLETENADALVMEGGASMVYYTNIEWELTERAFLVVLQLDDDEPTGIRTTIISPAFEATRALDSLKKANLPKEISPDIVEWLEYESPYGALKKVFGSKSNRIIVEEDARLFVFQGIVDGLGESDVYVAPESIRMLRMVKSEAELEIMRCANTVTELAIRTVRPHIKVGMSEFDIQNVMKEALHRAGLTNTWVLALVDENAALPHGSSSEKKVTKHSTVLIDTGGELLGYQSDTTRTFFMGKRGHNETIEDAWYLVRRAQENVLNRTGAGSTCAQVDLTARHIIDKGGYGKYFTHRLGHGIGLRMHDEPYMHQGNTKQFLQPGMTFSVEPGIYITNEFGIRLEDIVVVREDGKLELLTSGLAQNPWTL
ncbi:peptidase M24, structural domain-containing protein [Parasitella parasitica]|nr:peptidase M24, structural domain-containing protein [Parasitella parasitica]